MADKPHPSSGTFFAPPDRLPPEFLASLSDACVNHPVVRAILDAVEGYALVLDEHRQLLAANGELLDALKMESAACGVGKRPGELFGCIHAAEGPGGCGTSLHCSVCGAVIAILAAQARHEPATGDCRMTVFRNGELSACELRVRVSPLQLDGHLLYVAVLQDVSDEKRRRCLERIFFHDIMNTLQGLEGWSEAILLGRASPREVANRIVSLSGRLAREVQSQRILLEAEQGELAVSIRAVTVEELFCDLRDLSFHNEAARGRILDFVPPPADEAVSTDPSLLNRVLMNMVVNALEGTPAGGTVRIWFERRQGRPGVMVHNGSVIPEITALKIFQRSFSTKAKEGRGLGTYGMKLLGERYLGGEVTFTSREGEGTLFSIFLPSGSGGVH